MVVIEAQNLNFQTNPKSQSPNFRKLCLFESLSVEILDRAHTPEIPSVGAQPTTKTAGRHAAPLHLLQEVARQLCRGITRASEMRLVRQALPVVLNPPANYRAS